MKNLILCLLAGSIMLTSCKKNFDDDLPSNDTTKKEVIATYSSTVFAGGETAASVDGNGRDAKFFQINKVTADQAGNVYVLEMAKPGSSFFKIRKVSSGGVTTTVFNGGDPVLGFKGKNYKVLDIAARADGSVYALASMLDNRFNYIIDNTTKYYQEYGTYKLSGDSLVKVSVSTTIGNLGGQLSSWVAPHNLLTNIAVDAGGYLYGAYALAGQPGTAPSTKVYQITPNTKLVEGNTDAVIAATLTGGIAGTAYASTATNVLKITASGVSPIFTFPAVKTFNPKLAGSFAGNLVIYGDVYDKANAFKGTGFYIIKTDGTVVSKSILTTPADIMGAVMLSGKIYYVVKVNSGGYLIQKITLD